MRSGVPDTIPDFFILGWSNMTENTKKFIAICLVISGFCFFLVILIHTIT